MRFIPITRIEVPDKIHIGLPEFVIEETFNAPREATAVILQFICCVLDFPGKCGYYLWAEDMVMSPYDGRFPGGDLEFSMDDAEGKVLLTAIGLSFRNRYNYEIRNRKWQAGKLLDAVFIQDGKIVQFQYPEPAELPAEPEETVQRVAWKLRN